MNNSASLCFATEDYPPVGGGLAVSAHRICQYLAEDGFDVQVVTGSVPGGTAKETTIAFEDGVTVHRIHTRPGLENIFGVRHYVRQLHAERQFDLFHGFFLPAVLPCLAPARSDKANPRPVIASIRGSDGTVLFVHPYFRPLLLDALKQSAWVTSVNRAYLEGVSRQVDITGRCSVIRNSAPALHRTWELTEHNRGVVGTSGQFRRVKDIPLLVRAFQKIRPDLRRKLVLTGEFVEAAEEDWSWTLIREFGLADCVELTGMLPHNDAIAQLARMHVYVHCAAFEGMPNSVLEAVAVGVPVVATAAAGVKEMFTNEFDALLVPHGDPVALGRAVERVLDNDDLARSLSANAALLCARFSRQRERSEWVSLHRRMLAVSAEAREQRAVRG